MKKLIALVLAMVLAASMVACGSKDNSGAATEDAAKEGASDASNSGKEVLNIWSINDEIPTMVDMYLDSHPEFAAKYAVEYTVIDGDSYQTALDQCLINNTEDAPDIFAAEAGFALKYTQGDASQYVMPFEDLGIDVDTKIEEAQLAKYSVEIGTRPSDNKVVGLAFQSTGGAVVYRRSIAKDVFGTDEPSEIAKILGEGTGNLDKFFEAAEVLKQNGYAITSSYGDASRMLRGSIEKGWVVDGELCIDPAREASMDIAKMMKEKGYHNDTETWTDAWFADVRGEGAQPVFCFTGPAWLINFTLAPNCGGEKLGEGTYGDWAVCPPPVGFFWGGTWVMANKNTEHKEAVAELLEYITLDCTENGAMYAWANGEYGTSGTKDCVASGTVMEMCDGSIEFLNGQDMFEIFAPAGEYANGKILTQYDGPIGTIWDDQVNQYANGEKSKEDALNDFKNMVADNLDVVVNFD